MTSEPTVSPPVVMAKSPEVASAVLVGFEPVASASSSTNLPAPTSMVGVESAGILTVTVAVDSSPSPSVMV